MGSLCWCIVSGVCIARFRKQAALVSHKPTTITTPITNPPTMIITTIGSTNLVIQKCAMVTDSGLQICLTANFLPFPRRVERREVLSLDVLLQAGNRLTDLHSLLKQIIGEGQKLMSCGGSFKPQDLLVIKPSKHGQIMFKINDGAKFS